MICTKCGNRLQIASCPDQREGCCVLHLKCIFCEESKRIKEELK